jgi:mono/diheme cytochrome c family protein
MNVYLKSLAGPLPPSTSSAPKVEGSRLLTKNGAKLYETHCADCHGSKGEGIIGAYPPLANSRVVTMTNTANMVQKVLYGGYAPTTQGNPRPFGMPPFILKLNDQDMAELLTYIRNDWGNQASPVTALDVNRARERP